MPLINIPASKSLTISNNISYRPIKKEFIVVGKCKKTCYYSYIFFDTSSITNYMILLSAKLVLFKVADFINKDSVKFSIYPLCSYFSSFTTCKNACAIDPTLKHDFKPFTKNVVIEIDITDIAYKWLNDTLPNKGLLIKGISTTNNLSFTAFGSAYNKDNTLIPFMSINFLNQYPIFPPAKFPLKCSVSIIPERH